MAQTIIQTISGKEGYQMDGPNLLTHLHHRNISIYFLAGVATAPNFMEEFRIKTVERFQQAKWHVRHAEVLFPYGDWNCGLALQLHELRQDLYPLWKSKLAAIGGRAAAETIRTAYDGGVLMLIGHSGGGVAGIHAAELMMKADEISAEHIRLVQIGSPMCRVPAQLRASTLYISAAGDSVTFLGSWGGWEKGRLGIFRWNRRKFAPDSIVRVPIIGKHTDYFRGRSPYVNVEGISNLEVTLQSIWSWLQGGCS
ncbi:hypothetical protein KZ483_16975 [Paenibacillus sp. sptzw28]|uniref:hypothetical protein n=1 Tax=Paenibacillus sp. sptzw28 TaxID=715179 RepID=UPI001C6E6E93|nr:hypothetical protein [Paenibacillus sp. sptzw28]QYR19591.1 hypothetical protein KZ483_16975 [Paenibacillus sp. sptzw28]